MTPYHYLTATTLKNTMCSAALALVAGGCLDAADIGMFAGAQLTPDRTAIAPAGIQEQQSRPGPSAGITWTSWLTSHQGVGAETDFVNTNTRLANFAENNWTMNRISVDGIYTYRWFYGNLSPFVKSGLGVTVTASGQTPDHASAGLDSRLEEIAGGGFGFRISGRFGFMAEYEAHFFRNPDFSDHSWHPQRNVVSEPRIGIIYSLGRRSE